MRKQLLAIVALVVTGVAKAQVNLQEVYDFNRNQMNQITNPNKIIIMKTNSKLLIVIAIMVIHGSVWAYGPENQNSVASVSKLETWHLSKDNDAVKSIPKAHSTSLKLIIDVDPGTDDAVAIRLCKSLQPSPTHFVATMGNQPIKNTLCDLLILKNMFNLQGAVFKGMESSLRGKVPYCGDFHGFDGLAGLQDSLSKIYVSQKDYDACRTLDNLANEILLSDSCIYVATGPLSSLAYILEKYKASGIENHISKVIVMGGGINRFNIGGNREYNFAGDGEAVKIVFSSSLDITLFPLDITELFATIDSCQLDKIKSSPDVHPVISSLIQQNYESNIKYTQTAIGAVLHDCLPIIYLMHPEEFDVEDMKLLADSTGKISEDEVYGQIVHVAKSCDSKLLYHTILSTNN